MDYRLEGASGTLGRVGTPVSPRGVRAGRSAAAGLLRDRDGSKV